MVKTLFEIAFSLLIGYAMKYGGVRMLANRLNLLLAERGLSIKEVHEKTNLSRTTISNLVNNIGGGVQSATLNQLCMLLKIQPGEFFDFCPFDLSFSLENSDLKLLDNSLDNLTDDSGHSKEIRVTIDSGDAASLYQVFNTNYYFGKPARFDEREYKYNFDVYIYVQPEYGSYKADQSQRWFKSNYFEKMSISFQKQFFDELSVTATKGLSEFSDQIEFVMNQNVNKEKKSFLIFLVLPYGETRTIRLDPVNKKIKPKN